MNLRRLDRCCAIESPPQLGKAMAEDKVKNATTAKRVVLLLAVVWVWLVRGGIDFEVSFH
jgi:hypothetical protein